ncbi:MAG: hypothetical protein Q8Q09_27350 [Deltaproteobacteria bacterium]|nr:hypothetical protein [Deltaproteobacteria bacterium]
MKPAVFFATPRKLPKVTALAGRVVVLDIAFAADGTGASFDKITGHFIAGLGDRLARWVDHHDHELHQRYASDPRFVLFTKQQHGACPELVTPALVQDTGPVDTVVCHDDLDGIYSAAKWLLEGREPYEGADADARAVDTRTGTCSRVGQWMDRALRGQHRDERLRRDVLGYLVGGLRDPDARGRIDDAADAFALHEERAERLAERYVLQGSLAIVDATGFVEREGHYDKTLVLLLGQKRAKVSMVFDDQTVTFAAAFDSGVDLLALLGIQGGMPTRVSVPRTRLDEAIKRVREGISKR